MKKGFAVATLLAALFLIAARGPSTTEWSMKAVEKNLVAVPAQLLDTVTEWKPFRDGDSSRFVKIAPFYIFRFETSNSLYLYYLDHLRFVEKDEAAYRNALPDTLVWRMKLAYNEPYVAYYLRHPAYRNYPLVGVSWEQANAFCAWLTKTYNATPGMKYKNVRFDLPTANEWKAAARGGIKYAPFAWGGPNLRNSKGEQLANYRRISESAMMRDTVDGKLVYIADPDDNFAGMLNDAADITAPVDAYWPNSYGLYNVCGNVEELVKEKGISKGGSWHDPGHYLLLTSKEQYTAKEPASAERGFRIVMHVGQ